MKSKLLIQFAALCLCFSSCEKAVFEDELGDDPVTVFNYLWKEADEKYSFFEYKNIDWNQVKAKYQPLVKSNTQPVELFNICWAMLNELQDGHVNLIAPFNVSRYDFDLKGVDNYDERIIRESYLGIDYYQTGPLVHDFLNENKVGYVRYGSFTDQITNYQLDVVCSRFRDTKGLIVDIRENGGGSISNVFQLVNRFTDNKTLLYTSRIKNGRGRNDFSEAQSAYAEPYSGLRYTKPIMLLVDRASFSASSFFTLGMSQLDNVTVIGDTTGGGLGAPSAGQMPNGWTFRFSVTETLSPDGQNYENGVPPDIYVKMQPADWIGRRDPVIDKAIEQINSL